MDPTSEPSMNPSSVPTLIPSSQAWILGAEDNTESSGVTISTSTSHYTGTGYIDYEGYGSSTYIEWQFNATEAGYYRFSVRYALATTTSTTYRPLELTINSEVVPVGQFEFPPVASSWDVWQYTISILGYLAQGESTIRLRAMGSTSGPNVVSIITIYLVCQLD